MSFNSPGGIAGRISMDRFVDKISMSPIETNRVAKKIDLNKFQEKLRSQVRDDRKIEAIILPGLD
jgi:hypothetical protein